MIYILTLLLLAFNSAFSSYNVTDLGALENYSINDKTEIVGTTDDNSLKMYKQGQWINIENPTIDSLSIRETQLNNKGDILIKTVSSETNHHTPFVYYPEIGWINLETKNLNSTDPIDLNPTVMRVGSSETLIFMPLSINDNGLIAGIGKVQDQNVLFLYSSESGFRHVNHTFNFTDFQLNNNNTIFFRDNENILHSYSEQNGFKSLNVIDLGIKDQIAKNEDPDKIGIEYYNLSISNEGIISGTIAKYVEGSSEHYPTTYLFEYHPDGTLNVINLAHSRIEKTFYLDGSLNAIGVPYTAQGNIEEYFIWNQNDGYIPLIDLVPTEWKSIKGWAWNFKVNYKGDFVVQIHAENTSKTLLFKPDLPPTSLLRLQEIVDLANLATR